MSCLYQDTNSNSPMEWKALDLEVLPEAVFGDTTKHHKVGAMFRQITVLPSGV